MHSKISFYGECINNFISTRIRNLHFTAKIHRQQQCLGNLYMYFLFGVLVNKYCVISRNSDTY